MQDRDGFMWFGTAQGLSRFDAHNLLTFKLKNETGKIVDDQNITEIAELGDHLLLATGNGLYTLNKQSYAIRPFPNQVLRDQRITSIMLDKHKNIWIGSNNAIYVFRPDFSLWKSYKHDLTDKSSIPEGTINTIFEDNEGTIWMAVWTGGLHKLNTQHDRFQAFPKIGGRNNPFKIFQDDHNQRWIATWGDGLYRFNPSNVKEMYAPVNIQNKRRGQGNEELVYNIMQDSNKKYIWVLSFSGISTFQYTADKQLKEVDISPLFSNTSNIFNDLSQDRTGALWLSIGGKGVSTISFDKPDISHVLFDQVKERYGISPNINMLYKDGAGSLWFNVERIGMGKIAAGNREMITYSNAQFKDLMSIRAVNCALDVDDNIWIGSSYEPTINVFKKIADNMVLQEKIDLRTWSSNSGVPLFFLKDRAGNIWVATATGVLVRRADDKQFRAINGIQDQIVSISEDRAGDIWVATKGKGIFQFQRGNFTQITQSVGKDTPGMYTDQIETMAADQAGYLWIGTKDSRLVRYDIQQKNAVEIADAKLFSKNQILDIVALDSVIWLSSTRNIYKIYPSDNRIVEYSSEDGLQVSMFSKRAYTVDKQHGKVYFGGYNGVVSFSKSSFVPKHVPTVVVTDVKVNNVSSVLDADSGKFSIHERSLILDPDDQNIEISFSSLEFTHSDKIRFMYKLEGVDKDWVYAPRERLFATYNNLSKGNYRFLIKATDLNNKWSSAVTELRIEKKPAFYESNLAYLIYFLALAGVSYYLIVFSLHRLKLRSDLRIAQIEKETANDLIQTKLSYFTNISHDLLTPLTIISCLIDDVQITTKKNLSQFEKMRQNLQRLKRLLQQVLDFRRIENRQMELHVSQNHLDNFIAEICHSYFSPLAKKKEITFDISSETDIDEAYFDVDKMDKIIFNLLSNAFKYTGNGGTIEVKYKTVFHGDKTLLVLNVADNGIGIAGEQIDKIFTPFYTNRSAKQGESNGIGLALTKELVEIHKGKITVDSVLDKGTCFTVSIPIDATSYSAAERKHLQQFESALLDTSIQHEYELPDIEIGKLDTLNLLLVEDNEDLRLTIHNVLSRNYHVQLAANGEEALEIMSKEEIDIVISDIMMPVMDGLTLCRTIKADTEINHIPVILLTAKNSMQDRIDCYQAGADGYISKPFEIQVLEARIRSFVINKRVRQSDFKNNPQINISSLDYTPIDEQFLNKMIAVIEENLADDRFDVLILGDKLGLSKSTLYRKTKVLLDISPSEFIKNIRLKHACQMMDRDKSISVSEVAFATGFSDPRYFSTCFKAAFNTTPSAYQRDGSGTNS